MYSDLESVWNKASEDSVFVIYQHLQKNSHKHETDVKFRLGEVKELLAGASVRAIRKRELAFIIALRDRTMASRINTTIETHAKRHGYDVF